jgi:hypothetical protein
VADSKADPYRPETLSYTIKSRTYPQEEGWWELCQKRLKSVLRGALSAKSSPLSVYSIAVWEQPGSRL